MSEASLESSVEATREPSFLLAKPEKRLLTWIASRLPRQLALQRIADHCRQRDNHARQQQRTYLR